MPKKIVFLMTPNPSDTTLFIGAKKRELEVRKA